MAKDRLIKRLEWYYPAERFNAYLGVGAMAYVVYAYPLREVVWLIYGLFLVVAILWQGQRYWQLKLRRLTGKPIADVRELRWFAHAKRLNQLLIAGIPVALALQLYAVDWIRENVTLLGWAALANGFGVLEHINYYHRQLTIDNASDLAYVRRNRRLKAASLRKDLLEGKI